MHVRSMRLLVLTSWLILLFPALALSACASVPPIVAMPGACASLLPLEWRQPVPGTPLPENDTQGAWVAFADAQTGQLDKANDRTVTSIGIIERCEQMQRDAVASARRPWWKIL